MKMKPQPPERIEWEEAVLAHIELADICRSDAQGIIEADEEKLDALYAVGVGAVEAAEQFLNPPSDAS